MCRQRGFTLTELMVVVSIVAILLGIGVPSYRYITNSYRISSEVNGLLGDLMYARSEAIKEGQFVTVCATVNGRSCTGNTSWARGWLVFSDPTPNSGPHPPGPVLRTQARFAGSSPDSFDADNGVSSVTYNRAGFAATAGGFIATTVTLHDPTANPVWTRCLQITAQGMLNTVTPATDPSGTCN